MSGINTPPNQALIFKCTLNTKSDLHNKEMPTKNIRQHSFMNHTNTAKIMSVNYTSINKIVHNI